MRSGTSLPEFSSQAATNVRKDRELFFFFFPVSGGFSGKAAATELRQPEREGGAPTYPSNYQKRFIMY